MLTKRVLRNGLLALICLIVPRANSQLTPAPSSTGNITTNAANCNTTNACIVLHMATSNVGYSVTVSGTWTGTLTVEQSGDNQGSWTSATTTTGNTLFTSALTPGITDVRVRGSAAMTGTAVVTITASGPATLNQITQTGSSVTPNTPIPAAQQQGPAYNVRNYGAVGDAKSSRNCVTTNTGSTITNIDNPWAVTDIGKKLQAVGNATSSFAGNEVTITVFNSAGSISVTPSVANKSATGTCVWYTQQDHTAMLAAYTAADIAALNGKEPGYGTPTLVHPGQVFIPKGGYVVCGTIYNDINHVGTNNEGVSLIGEPGTDIYVAPCFVPPNASANVGTLILAYLNQRAEFAHLYINGMGFLNTNFSANQYLFGTLSSGGTWIHDVRINDFGSSQSTAASIGMVTGSALSRIENLLVQNQPVGDASWSCYFDGVGLDMFSSFCSNHFKNFFIANSGQRTVFAPHFVMHGVQGDECGPNGLACMQLQNSTVNCIGCELMNPGGGVASVSLDTTSSLYLTDSTLLTYDSDSGNSSAIVLAGNAQVYASQSNFSGNNTSAAIAGPGTATFVDIGGNKWFNQVAGVQTACTAATYTTCAFSGGIIPKATVTHTPNTCYVTGTFGATTAAAPMCASYADQNYQILRIKAASTTVTACATPPVVTISDGVQTATLTLTTAKSIWDSAVDTSSGILSVFATGNTIVASNTAGTCATPPTNFSVTMTLQSVLNP